MVEAHGMVFRKGGRVGIEAQGGASNFGLRNPPWFRNQGVILRVENPPYRGFPTDSQKEYCDGGGTASIILSVDK